jgi:hypothetical protein
MRLSHGRLHYDEESDDDDDGGDDERRERDAGATGATSPSSFKLHRLDVIVLTVTRRRCHDTRRAA